MNIQILSPLIFTQKGKREKNEDAIFPILQKASTENRLFIVCDGVGGARKGEIAASLVAFEFEKYLRENLSIPPIDKEFLDKGLKLVESEITQFLEAHPECKSMATTLALLHFDDHGAVFAWVGDSRIYQFRKGKIIYQTQDHSLVGELVKQGHLTSEQAANHPKRNIILRAIKGLHDSTQLDFHRSQDIKKGDRFLVCSDGVMESFTDLELNKAFSEKKIENVYQTIIEKCEKHSVDNFSGHIIEVQNIDDRKKLSKMVKGILIGLLVIILSFGVYKFLSPAEIVNREDSLDKLEETENPVQNDQEAALKTNTLKDFFSLREALQLNQRNLEENSKDSLLLTKNDSLKTELTRYSPEESIEYLVEKACTIINNGDPKTGEELLKEAQKIVEEAKLDRRINIDDELSRCQALLI